MTNATAKTGITPTDEQREILAYDGGHMIVEAGAGSGKTRMIVEKILREIGFGHPDVPAADTPLDIGRIAAITFTRKAAGEIKERLRQRFHDHAALAHGLDRERWAERAFAVEQAQIGTIDAFAGRIVREFGYLANVEAGFEVLDPGDASALHAEVAEVEILAGIDRDDPGAVFLVKHFGFLRARQVLAGFFQRADLLHEIAAREEPVSWRAFKFEASTVDILLERASAELLPFVQRAREGLERRMDEDGTLDHAHVALRALDLASHPEVQRAFRDEVSLLFVDEHQDTNPAQVEMIFRLAGVDKYSETSGTRLVLIGDPKQGIYGFRGADITMWRKSLRAVEAAGGRGFTLSSNFRSRPGLLRFYDATLGPVLGRAHDDDPARVAKGSRYDVPYRALRPGRDEREGTCVEFLLSEGNGFNQVEPTADVIAERISQMLRHPDAYPVYERGADGSEVRRPLRASDIAILSRNLAGTADQYERSLRARSIDSYVYGGRGLYSRSEVADITALLRVVADPEDDFALAALLRSPLVGMDDHTLMELAASSTAAGERRPLFQALAEAPAGHERHAHARDAHELIVELRELRDRLSHDRLLELAFERTGFRAFLAGAPDAPAGLRNIEKVLRVARRSGTEPLFEFVRKLDGRIRRADPEGEAPLYSPDDDLVVISTIHKAKGLEWPYVFVAGIDQGMFSRVGDREPHLSRELGVALPMDVVLHDRSTRAEASEESRAWKHFFEDATRKQMAEARRLLYVACTRAREGLFLAGEMTHPDKPRYLDSRTSYAHRDGYERWFRHLYPALPRQGTTEIAYGDTGRAVVRRGLAQMAHDWSPTGEAAEGTTARTDPARMRNWPAAPVRPSELGAPAGEEWDDALQRRISPVRHHSILRREFSASEISQYSACAWKHYFGYQGGVSSGTIETSVGDNEVNRIAPAKRGDVLHDFLQVHEDGWDADRRFVEMRRVLLRHLPMGEDAAEQNAREILGHAENFLDSDLYRRIQASRTVLREVPYVCRINDDLRVSGQIDLMWLEDDGWRILDFKSGLFRGQAEVDQEVQRRADAYRLPAAIYSMAVAKTFEDPGVREFHFFFTANGETSTIPATADWIGSQMVEVQRIVDRIRADEEPAEPQWGDVKCRNCDYIRLCRPNGEPDEARAAA